MVKYKKDAKKLKKYVQDHQEEIEHMDRLAATAAFELMGESKAARAIWEKADGKEEEEVGSAWQEILQEREDIGVDKGMEAFGRMIDGLINEGRSHLIPALSKDEALRKELYSKYCEENSLYDKIK